MHFISNHLFLFLLLILMSGIKADIQKVGLLASQISKSRRKQKLFCEHRKYFWVLLPASQDKSRKTCSLIYKFVRLEGNLFFPCNWGRGRAGARVGSGGGGNLVSRAIWVVEGTARMALGVRLNGVLEESGQRIIFLRTRVVFQHGGRLKPDAKNQ